MARALILIHFLPIELYPPAMNLLDFIAEDGRGKVVVITMGRRLKGKVYESSSNSILIKRYGTMDETASSFYRYWQYLTFYLSCLKELILRRPDRVLYFETLSSFPVYLYKRFVRTSLKVYVHYHEYVSKEEEATGMRLYKYFHRLERKLYAGIEWLSHTNAERLRLFLLDEGLSKAGNYFVMPNYPGRNWYRPSKARKDGFPKAMVYVGAVGRDTMYFNEIVRWLLNLEGKFTLDIYSNNISEADRAWLMTLPDAIIRLHPGVIYSELPDLISTYDIGVILYKGHIPNYVHNAPNKLFEYMACGLDVWVPVVMEGCRPYYTDKTYPKVVPVDFDRMDAFDWNSAIARDGLNFDERDYFYESEYPLLVSRLFSS